MAPAVEVMAPTQISAKAEASENAMSVKVLDELLSKLNISKTQDETNAAAINIATFINGPIEEHDAPTKYDTLVSPHRFRCPRSQAGWLKRATTEAISES